MTRLPGPVVAIATVCDEYCAYHVKVIGGVIGGAGVMSNPVNCIGPEDGVTPAEPEYWVGELGLIIITRSPPWDEVVVVVDVVVDVCGWTVTVTDSM